MNCIGLFLAVTLHLGLDQNYNSVHPHARCTVNDYITGVYYNSEHKLSAYAGKQYAIGNGHLELGIVSGYTAEDILPMARYKVGTWFIAPAYEKQNGIENLGILVGWEIGL